MTEKRILLVEDNPDDEALTLRAIKKCGIPVTVDMVRDGAEALAYLAGPQAGNCPDLVLLDLKLPKVDGLDLLRTLNDKGLSQGLTIVVFTSSKEQSDIIRSYQNGATSYVCKPVDFQQFMDTVQTICRYWLALNIPQPDNN